jgi:hypothetical protein
MDPGIPALTSGYSCIFEDDAPKYIRGHSITLGFVIISWIFTAANVSVNRLSLLCYLFTLISFRIGCIVSGRTKLAEKGAGNVISNGTENCGTRERHALL